MTVHVLSTKKILKKRKGENQKNNYKKEEKNLYKK
jgi:hypothetical protein